MNDTKNGKSFKWCVISLFGLLGAGMSGHAALYGAMAMGFRDGGWNWQLLPYVVGGWLGGLLLAFLAWSFVASRWRQRPIGYLIFLPLIAPPLLAFIGGATAGPAAELYRQRLAQQRQEGEAAARARYELFYGQLQTDPEIVFREKWFATQGERRRAFERSLKDKSIPYTVEQLKLLFAEHGIPYVFAHPACTTDFLSEHFEEAYKKAFHFDDLMLAAIVSNAKTPKNLLERVAYSKSLPMGAVRPARETLEKIAADKG